MEIIEGSDTMVTFKITETNNGTTTNVDLTTYDEVVLTLLIGGGVLELQGDIDNQDHSLVTFDIVSELTTNKCWALQADIRGLKDAKKLRFNQTTILGSILHSVKVPAWA